MYVKGVENVFLMIKSLKYVKVMKNQTIEKIVS